MKADGSCALRPLKASTCGGRLVIMVLDLTGRVSFMLEVSRGNCSFLCHEWSATVFEGEKMSFAWNLCSFLN